MLAASPLPRRSFPAATKKVFEGGISDATTIQAGGIEKVAGTANNTSIFPGGELIILSGGTANNVAFIDNGAQHNAALTLSLPTGLTGTITGWHVGDVIDFVNTTVTNVSVENNILTLTYGEGLRGPESDQVSYQLASLQSNTHFELQSDGEGGTELTLQPGAQSEASLVDVPLIGMSVEGAIALWSDAPGGNISPAASAFSARTPRRYIHGRGVRRRRPTPPSALS